MDYNTIQTYLNQNRTRLTYDTWASLNHNFLFVHVPKAGCTKIKNCLQELCGLPVPSDSTQVHNRRDGKFVRSLFDFNADQRFFLITDPSVFRFTVVRNPYTRALSGYLSKVVGPKKFGKVKESVNEFHQTTPEGTPTFREFLQWLASVPDTQKDIHFRSQSAVMHHDVFKYSFTGRFESFQPDLHEILNRLDAPQSLHDKVGDVQNKSQGDTSLSAFPHQDILARQSHDIIYDMYSQDFKNFGYAQVRPFNEI